MSKKSRYQVVVARLLGNSDSFWCWSILDSRSNKIYRVDFIWAASKGYTVNCYLKPLRSGEMNYHDLHWDKGFEVREHA